MPDNIRSSIRLFADDFVLYKNVHSLQYCLILQEDLTSLGQWEADWQMKFNIAKCHSMRVTRHQHHKQILFDYSLYNQTVENVQSAKYLGMTITNNMDWVTGRTFLNHAVFMYIKIVFTLTNSEDPNEMPPNAAFHLSLSFFLYKYSDPV